MRVKLARSGIHGETRARDVRLMPHIYHRSGFELKQQAASDQKKVTMVTIVYGKIL